MNNIAKTTLKSFGLMLIFTAILGGIYPMITSLLLEGFAKPQSIGSLIKAKDGSILGSSLIGQNFEKPKYLWGRLSATSTPYDAAASSGSNLGVNNPVLLENAKARIENLKKYKNDENTKIPVDLVTASGSGLDPEISPAAAYYQIPRIAKARGITGASVKAIIDKSTKKRTLNLLGESRVNVLEVNLRLDGKID